MKDILKNDRLLYTLLQDDDGVYVLSTACGGVAMYDVMIRLNEHETARFEADGADFLDELARDVQRETNKYLGRAIR